MAITLNTKVNLAWPTDLLSTSFYKINHGNEISDIKKKKSTYSKGKYCSHCPHSNYKSHLLCWDQSSDGQDKHRALGKLFKPATPLPPFNTFCPIQSDGLHRDLTLPMGTTVSTVVFSTNEALERAQLCLARPASQAQEREDVLLLKPLPRSQHTALRGR